MLDVLIPLSDCKQESVENMDRRILGVSYMYVWDGFPQRDFVLWVFMCPNNITLFFDSILASTLCVFSVSLLRLPRQGLPRPIYIARAITPSPLHGYHACVFTSRLPRHSYELHFRVIIPELSRFTTHVPGKSGYHTRL